MGSRTSAGIVVHRRTAAGLEVLLGHLGGPYYTRKDDGAWSIPKGEYDDGGEPPFDAACREFAEEMGTPPPRGTYRDLGTITQANGKRVSAWAVEGDFDPASHTSNTFELEWPPRSGRRQQFPEVDRVAWFTLDVARAKVVRGQDAVFDRLLAVLGEA